jgi:hypothetical protein
MSDVVIMTDLKHTFIARRLFQNDSAMIISSSWITLIKSVCTQSNCDFVSAGTQPPIYLRHRSTAETNMAAPPTDNSNSNNNQDALSPTTEQLAVERHWYEGGEGHQVPIDRERLPLLGHTRREEALDKVVQWAGQKTRSGLYGLLTFIFVVLVVLTLGFYGDDLGYLPRNSHAAALKILSSRRIIVCRLLFFYLYTC